MGCFNLQCGYSGTEVHEGDKVQLFLMVNNQFGDGFIGFQCYPQDCFSLLGPGIVGEYDEYGWYNIEENIISQHLQRQVTDMLIPLEEGAGRHDRGGKEAAMKAIAHADEAGEQRPLLPWDVIGDMIHDGELFVKNQYDKTVQVYISKFAVHKELYDEMNAKDLKESFYQKDSPLMRDKIRGLVQDMRKPDEDESEIAGLEALERDLTDEEKRALRRAYRRLMRCGHDELRMEHNDNRFTLQALSEFKNDDGEQATEDELVEAFHGLIALQSAMSTNNKQYLPQGPGHQCYNFDTEIEYHELILQMLKAKHKAKMIDWGEWDENGNPYKYDDNGDPIEE